MTRAGAARIAATVALATILGGCINPFNPSARVELASITANGSTSELIAQYADLTRTTINYNLWTVSCHVVVKNTVAVNLSSVNIMYTDIEGNPVTAYATSGGRNYRMMARIEGLNGGNMNYTTAEGNAADIGVQLIDYVVLTELVQGAKILYVTITFMGQDDNGYDVKVSGTVTIRVYGP